MPDKPKSFVPTPTREPDLTPRTAAPPVFRPNNALPQAGSVQLRRHPASIAPASSLSKPLSTASRPAAPPVYRPNGATQQAGESLIQQRPQNSPLPPIRSMQSPRSVQRMSSPARLVGSQVIQATMHPAVAKIYREWEELELLLDDMYERDPSATLPISEQLELARKVLNGSEKSILKSDIRERMKDIERWIKGPAWTRTLPKVIPIPTPVAVRAVVTDVDDGRDTIWKNNTRRPLYAEAFGGIITPGKRHSEDEIILQLTGKIPMQEKETRKIWEKRLEKAQRERSLELELNAWPCRGSGDPNCHLKLSQFAAAYSVNVVVNVVGNSGGYESGHSSDSKWVPGATRITYTGTTYAYSK